MVWRMITSWTATTTALIAVVGWWALQVLPPASYYFDANHMQVADAPAGAEIILFVDREIKRPVYGRWTVTVRKQTDDGWELACVPARGVSDYFPQAKLPDPLTLSWWTDGQCTLAEPGKYFITTTWSFEPQGLPGVRTTRPLVSNIFTITEVEG